jgi:hypothetical protein
VAPGVVGAEGVTLRDWIDLWSLRRWRRCLEREQELADLRQQRATARAERAVQALVDEHREREALAILEGYEREAT